VTIFVSSVTDFPIIEEALRLLERACGATTTAGNPKRSQQAAGELKKLYYIKYCQSVTMLGKPSGAPSPKRQVIHGRASPRR
jgi:hypothetical protein